MNCISSTVSISKINLTQVGFGSDLNFPATNSNTPEKCLIHGEEDPTKVKSIAILSTAITWGLHIMSLVLCCLLIMALIMLLEGHLAPGALERVLAQRMLRRQIFEFLDSLISLLREETA